MTMRKPVVRLRDRGNCYLGEVEMPTNAGGTIRISQLGWSPGGALRKAASAASRVMNDPAMQMILPPQVKVAVSTARALSKMSVPGLKQIANQLSPAARSLAISLIKRAGQTYAPPGGTAQQPTAAPAQATVVPQGVHADTHAIDQAATAVNVIEPPSNIPPYLDPNDPSDAAALNAWGAEAFQYQQGQGETIYPDEEDDEDEEPEIVDWNGEYDDGHQEPSYYEDHFDDEES